MRKVGSIAPKDGSAQLMKFFDHQVSRGIEELGEHEYHALLGHQSSRTSSLWSCFAFGAVSVSYGIFVLPLVRAA